MRPLEASDDFVDAMEKIMPDRQPIRSDELPLLRRMFSENGVFAQFGHLIQIKLVLDANAVLADLRWLVCKAKKANARTNLLESIQSETIVVLAPTYLNVEIEKNIPLIAEEEGVDPDLLVERWSLYKKNINFVESGGPEESAIDGKDVPYVKLHMATGYSVLTQDSHISKMGADAVGIEVTAFAKNYARNAVIEYTIKAGYLSAFIVTASMIGAAATFIREALRHTGKIPIWAWVTVIGLFLLALCSRTIRGLLLQEIRDLSGSAAAAATSLFKTLEPVFLDYQRSHLAAAESKNQLSRKVRV